MKAYESANENHRERNRKYQREWYSKNKELHKERVAKNNKEYKKKAQAFITEVKSAGCSRCDEKDPICLEFHHLDPSKKDFAISNKIGRISNLKVLEEEIKKCILLCANCHRKEHYYGPRLAGS